MTACAPTRFAHRCRPRCTDCFGRVEWYAFADAAGDLGQDVLDLMLGGSDSFVTEFGLSFEDSEVWHCKRCGAGGVIVSAGGW